MGFGKLLALAFKSGASQASQAVVQGLHNHNNRVDWEDYNYPPLVRVVHYELDDVEVPEARNAVRWAHYSYLLGLVTLVLNAIATLTLAIGGVGGKGVEVVYAIFNIIIFAIVGMYAFYHAYKGLATQNSRLTTRFLIIQLVILVFMIVCCLVGKSNYNGWLNLKRSQDSSKMSAFWVPWTIIESSLWSINIVICSMAIYLVFHNDRHAARSITSSSLLSAAAPQMRI